MPTIERDDPRRPGTDEFRRVDVVRRLPADEEGAITHAPERAERQDDLRCLRRLGRRVDDDVEQHGAIADHELLPRTHCRFGEGRRVQEDRLVVVLIERLIAIDEALHPLHVGERGDLTREIVKRVDARPP